MNYTHIKQWIFTPEALLREKERKSDKIKYRIIKSIETEKGNAKDLMIINVDSEMETIRYYITSLRKITYNYPINIFNTASHYILRFYLRRSIYAHDPLKMLYAALCLAMKVEEFHFNIKEYCEKCAAHCTNEELIQYENALINSLKFNMKVLSAYDSIEVLLHMDILKGVLKQSDVECVRTKAYLNADLSFLTDAVFLMQPNRIGFACYRMAFKETD